MANIQGVVLSVSLSTQVKKQTGGTYEAWELVYKGVDGEVRSFQKPVQGLKFNAKLKEQLLSLKQGEEFTAITDKNAAGFIEVKSIEKGLIVAEQPSSGGQANAKQTSNNYNPREFETAAERAKKQVYINRLACLNTASTLFGGKPAKPQEVIAAAEELYAYVVSDVSINQIESDIPY